MMIYMMRNGDGYIMSLHNPVKSLKGKTGQLNDDTKLFEVKKMFFSANTSSYSHYVFSTLDLDDTGVITFEV